MEIKVIKEADTLEEALGITNTRKEELYGYMKMAIADENRLTSVLQNALTNVNEINEVLFITLIIGSILVRMDRYGR